MYHVCDYKYNIIILSKYRPNGNQTILQTVLTMKQDSRYQLSPEAYKKLSNKEGVEVFIRAHMKLPVIIVQWPFQS